MIIRVLKWDPNNYGGWYRTWWLWRKYQEYYEDRGIKLVTSRPDVIISPAVKLPSDMTSIPRIIEDNDDQTSLGDHKLDLLAKKDVVAYFKNVTFRWPEYYLRNIAAGDYYGHVWYRRDWNRQPPLQEHVRESAHLGKIKLGFPLCCPPSEITFTATAAQQELRRRPLDMFFSGRTSYGEPAPHPELQRTRLRMLWNRIRGTKRWVGYESVRGHVDGLPYLYYMAELCRTKIAVSPWGYGAWNIRDYEALTAGCILVKPECSALQCVPDIYDPANRHVVYCNADMSNLPQVVDFILSNLDLFQPISEAGRALMEEWFNPPDKALNYWIGQIRGVVDLQ